MDENVQVDKQLLSGKETEVSLQNVKNKQTIKEILDKKTIYMNKNEDLKFLKHQLNRLQESVCKINEKLL